MENFNKIKAMYGSSGTSSYASKPGRMQDSSDDAVIIHRR